jgi:hypothetical protein
MLLVASLIPLSVALPVPLCTRPRAPITSIRVTLRLIHQLLVEQHAVVENPLEFHECLLSDGGLQPHRGALLKLELRGKNVEGQESPKERKSYWSGRYVVLPIERVGVQIEERYHEAPALCVSRLRTSGRLLVRHDELHHN